MTLRNAPLSRRNLLVGGLAASAFAGLSSPALVRAQAPRFTLMTLPYPESALDPVISATTVGIHHGRHHNAYVTGANNLLATDALRDQSIVDILKSAAINPNRAALFNNVGQIYNHDFYWNSLRPNGGGMPSGRIGDMIKSSFGDYAQFKQAFAASTIGQFASGWGWLCKEGDKLTIRRTGNADTPVYLQGVVPLLTIDVWEHAYYLDYQNRRADYVNAVIDKLLNWDFAEKNLG